MRGKIVISALMILASGCVPNTPPVASSLAEKPIQYATLDRAFVSSFSSAGARINMDWILRAEGPAFAIREVRRDDGVDCISIGPDKDPIDFAIKRPIRQGEIYSCGQSTFQVERCYDDCKSASVLISNSVKTAKHRRPPQYRIYVNQCIGIVIINFGIDFLGGTSQASYLLGERGILADSDFPDCIMN